MSGTLRPFVGNRDAKVYIGEYALITSLLALGIGAFVSRHGTIPGTIILIAATGLLEVRFGRRGRKFGLRPPYGPRRVSDEARAIEVLRLRYLRIAFKEVGFHSKRWTIFLSVGWLALGMLGYLVLR